MNIWLCTHPLLGIVSFYRDGLALSCGMPSDIARIFWTGCGCRSKLMSSLRELVLPASTIPVSISVGRPEELHHLEEIHKVYLTATQVIRPLENRKIT
jgi:hypothetical protein